MRGAGKYSGHLLVQSGSVVYVSTNKGEEFRPLCAMPTAPTKTGFANGLGLLSDGTLLAARYHTRSVAVAGDKAQTQTQTTLYTGSLPTAGVGASESLGSCRWSPGFTLPPRGHHLNSVGGGLGIRFTEAPPPSAFPAAGSGSGSSSTSSSRSSSGGGGGGSSSSSSSAAELVVATNASVSVLFAVRNELSFTPQGAGKTTHLF